MDESLDKKRSAMVLELLGLDDGVHYLVLLYECLKFSIIKS